jgi:hypothetical protein
MLGTSVSAPIQAPKRILPEPLRANLWKPGQSGNPGGKGGKFLEAQQICRTASPEAARKLVELLDSQDERIVGYAADKIREWAWGKIPDYDPSKEDQPSQRFDPSRLSVAQLAEVKRLMATLLQAMVPVSEAGSGPTIVSEVVPQDGATDTNASDINTLDDESGG